MVCVAGARDSYSKSILNDKPFSWYPDFLYDDRYDLNKLKNHLEKVGKELIAKLNTITSFSDNQKNLIIDLIVHEYLHQGQLIRYIYSNDLKMPHMMKEFWHLED